MIYCHWSSSIVVQSPVTILHISVVGGKLKGGGGQTYQKFLTKKNPSKKNKLKKPKVFRYGYVHGKLCKKVGSEGEGPLAPPPTPGFRLVYILTFILKTTKPIVIYIIYRMRGLYIVKFMTLSPLGLYKQDQVQEILERQFFFNASLSFPSPVQKT